MATGTTLISRIQQLTCSLLLVFGCGVRLAAGDESEDAKQERQDSRSHALAVLFGFYVVSLMIFFVIGLLLVVSMFGFRVFARLPRLPNFPLRTPDDNRYQTF